jgi:hypothetical protein
MLLLVTDKRIFVQRLRLFTKSHCAERASLSVSVQWCESWATITTSAELYSIAAVHINIYNLRTDDLEQAGGSHA